jgi:hypothetical protein
MSAIDATFRGRVTRLKQYLPSVLFVGLVLALGCWILSTSLGFQECVKTYRANDPSDQHFNESISRIVLVLLTWRHCAGAYVVEQNAVITALGTVIIAVFTTILGLFTIRLAGSTRIAADAAKIAGEHIPRVERAYLFVVVKSENFGKVLTEYANMTDDNLNERTKKGALIVNFSIENQGKTPAIIKSVSGQMHHYKALSDEPGYGAPLDVPKNRYLGSGQETEPIMVNLIAPTYKTIGMLMRNESAIWFYGRVTYDDIFGEGHEHRFCWRYSSGYFLPHYRDEKYIQNT